MARFCTNISMMFAERPLRERFAAAKRAGFPGVEIQFPYELAADDMARLARLAGVEIVSFNTPIGDRAAGEVGIASLPRREADFRQHVILARDYAVAVRCKNVNVLVGVCPDGGNKDRCINILYDNLHFAATELAAAGIGLTMEPMNTTDRPGYLLNTLDDAAAVIERIGHRNLKIEADIYHMAMMGEDIPASLRRNLKHIGHVQFADWPGRHEPGTGALDLPSLVALLEEGGYEGWFSAEYVPSQETERTLSWYDAWRSGGG